MAEKRIFSTADMIVNWDGTVRNVTGMTASYWAEGGHLADGNVAQAIDGNDATTVSLSAVITQQNDYIVLDLGSFYNIYEVDVHNATGGSCDLSVWACASQSDKPGTAGTTQIGASQPLTGTPINCSFSTAGTVFYTRYLAVFAHDDDPQGNHTGAVGEIIPKYAPSWIPPSGIKIGTMQNISFESAYSRKDILDAAQNSIYSIDCADHEGKHTIKCESAEFDAQRLQIMAAAQVSSGGSASVATIMGGYQLPYFTVTSSLLAQDGSTVTVTANRCKANDLTLGSKLTDFVTAGFTVDCYVDSGGVVVGYAF